MKHFIADPHFDHENVLEMSGRLFPGMVEHNDCIIDCINRYVAENDTLYWLGDVAWHSIDNYLARIRCKDVHLIWGNHDKANFGKHFKTHQDVLEIKIGKKPNQIKVFLSHYAHAYWPASHHGAFHLYGHTHRQREETLDAAFPGRRSIDVGVDNAKYLFGEYRPFSEQDIMDLLAWRPGHDLPEFYEAFQYNLPKYEPPTQAIYLNVPYYDGPTSSPEVNRRINEPGGRPSPFARPTHYVHIAAPTEACPVLPEDQHASKLVEIEESPAPKGAKEVAHQLNNFFLRNGNYGQVIIPKDDPPEEFVNEWVI